MLLPLNASSPPHPLPLPWAMALAQTVFPDASSLATKPSDSPFEVIDLLPMVTLFVNQPLIRTSLPATASPQLASPEPPMATAQSTLPPASSRATNPFDLSFGDALRDFVPKLAVPSKRPAT